MAWIEHGICHRIVEPAFSDESEACMCIVVEQLMQVWQFIFQTSGVE
jgi:hypothetical protein